MDEQLFKLVSEGGSSAKDIRMLIDNGARVGFIDHAGWTLLHWACRGKGPESIQIAKLLVSEGVPVNARNHRGETPLHMAAANGRLKIGCLLLDHGASMFAKDKQGNTPIDIANPTNVAATFLARKKELDKVVNANSLLITFSGSQHRRKFEKLLRDEHEQLIEHVQQEKMTILATQATSIQSVQSTIETLQQRMNHLEQQLQQYQNNNNHDKNVDDYAEENNNNNNECNKPRASSSSSSSQYDQPVGGEQEPPMKRRRNHELILQTANNTVVSTSSSCSTIGASCLRKVKMEQGEEAIIGDNNNDTDANGDVSSTANCDAQQKEHQDHRDFSIAALEQKVQHLQGELEASQETAHCYKMELDEYKKKMNQLHQLTG